MADSLRSGYSTVFTAALFLAVGCGARQPPAESQSAQAPSTSSPAAPTTATKAGEGEDKPSASAELSRDIPSECAGDAEGCVPPVAFAEQLCKGKFPDLAIHLFSKRMPWEKAYVKAEWLEPVNAYGGTQSERWLQFGEEVLVIKKHGAGKRGVQVSGPSDIDILRLDGTCATVRSEMLVSYVPAQVIRPHIVWKYLDATLQDALLSDKFVKQASAREREACRGSSVTHPEGACDKAMKTLTEAIVAAVHKDITLPEPEKRPAWAKP
jgi:hypothetical protein